MSARARVLWVICAREDVPALDRLILSGLTIDDARAQNNYALRWACVHGYRTVVDRLLELGLTLEDALRYACMHGHLAVVERLLELGLTIADARADNNFALIRACMHGHYAVVCTLAAAGVIEPVGDLQVSALEQILREPTMSRLDEPEAARRADTRRAAALAAAEWPGHAEAHAQLGPEAATAWEELYTEATLTEVGPLRFAD